MAAKAFIDFANPANLAVLAAVHVERPEQAVVHAPHEVNGMRLGTHPDLVDYLWGLGRALDPACPCVVNATSNPLLAHPVSGVIFALAGGTSTFALRLPDPERAEMMAVPGYGAEYRYPYTTIRARDFGESWVLIRPFEKRNPKLCRSAFDYAATLGQ